MLSRRTAMPSAAPHCCLLQTRRKAPVLRFFQFFQHSVTLRGYSNGMPFAFRTLSAYGRRQPALSGAQVRCGADWTARSRQALTAAARPLAPCAPYLSARRGLPLGWKRLRHQRRALLTNRATSAAQRACARPLPQSLPGLVVLLAERETAARLEGGSGGLQFPGS